MKSALAISVFVAVLIISASSFTCVDEKETPTPAEDSAFGGSPAGTPLDRGPRFTHLTTKDGLSEGRVWGIMQDSRGCLILHHPPLCGRVPRSKRRTGGTVRQPGAMSDAGDRRFQIPSVCRSLNHQAPAMYFMASTGRR